MDKNKLTEDNESGFGECNGNAAKQPADEKYDIENIMMTTQSRGMDKRQNTGFSEAWGEKSAMPVDGEIENRPRRTHRKPWLEALTAFAADVSVVGLNYVANPSASVFRRSVWVLLILVGAGFTVFQIQNRIRYYAGYPVNVIIRVDHVEEMRFPTVTICNENMASLSRVAAVCE